MEGYCRGCLQKQDDPIDLIPYNEKNRRLFVYSTGIQVKRNDTFPFQLCKECYLNLKQSCKFKKQCRTSDKKFKNYIALKEYEDDLVFEDFMKTNEECFTLRLPLENENNTYNNQKRKEDDNVSTCTSIRNFMTDMLQGEEVPDTEARIIKELIEEEADIFEDSLDSHWLEDDMSIDTEFRMDFPFSPFSTTLHSINYDHCYTPKRIDDDVRPLNKYLSPKSMPILDSGMEIDDEDDDYYGKNTDPDINYFEKKSNNDEINKDNNDTTVISVNNDHNHLETNDSVNHHVDVVTNINHNNVDIMTNNINHNDVVLTNNNDHNNVEIMRNNDHNNVEIKTNNNDHNRVEIITSGIEKVINDSLNNDILDLNEQSSDFIAPTNNENDLYEVENQVKNKSLQLNDELDYYINKMEIKKKKERIANDAIDRNLEIALQNNDDVFPLDQLLASPQVSLPSGASTPTIRNIIYGDSIDINNITSNNKLSPVHSDIDILDLLNNKNEQYLATKDNITEEIIKNISINDTLEREGSIKKETDDGLVKKSLFLNDSLQENDRESVMKNERDDLLFKKPFLLNENSQKRDKKGADDVFKKPLSPNDKYDLKQSLCKICTKQFASTKALKVHFSKFHNYIIKDPNKKQRYRNSMFLCKHCGKQYHDMANLSKHVSLKHKGDRENNVVNTECGLCKLPFASVTALNKHMRVHKDETTLDKKYQCSVCGKNFAKEANYILHNMRHEKNYQFKCVVCDRGFYRNTDLVSHMRTHTGEKPFTCKYCNKSFKRGDILNNHIKIHLGNFTYSCPKCKLSFVNRSVLKKHMNNVNCGTNEHTDVHSPTVSVMTGSNTTILDKLYETQDMDAEDNEL